MSRTRGKSIDQIEQASEASIFEDRRKEPKEFLIERDAHGLYFIKYSAGGEVPDSLKGRWTNISRAQEAVDNLLTERTQKQQSQSGAASSSSAS